MPLYLGPHAIRPGLVYELTGLTSVGKTELCRELVAATLAKRSGTTAQATQDEEGDIWWLSSDSDIRSSAHRIKELLQTKWGIADEGKAKAILDRLRCFHCFDLHSLMTLLKKASFASALPKKALQGSSGGVVDLVDSITDEELLTDAFLVGGGDEEDDDEDDRERERRELEQQLLEAALDDTIEVTEDGGDDDAGAGGKQAAGEDGAAAASSSSSSSSSSSTSPSGNNSGNGGGSEHSMAQLRPKPIQALLQADFRWKRDFGKDNSSSDSTSLRPLSLLIIDDLADMVGAAGSSLGLKNFASFALLSTLGRLLHSIAIGAAFTGGTGSSDSGTGSTSGSGGGIKGCPVVVTTMALAAKDGGSGNSRGDPSNPLFAGPPPLPLPAQAATTAAARGGGAEGGGAGAGVLEGSLLPLDPATGRAYATEAADLTTTLFDDCNNNSILMPLHAGPRNAIKPVLNAAAWSHVPDASFLVLSPRQLALLKTHDGEAHAMLYTVVDANVR